MSDYMIQKAGDQIEAGLSEQQELYNKIALLERKLAKAVEQRDSLIYPDNDNYYELTSIFNKELAELK